MPAYRDRPPACLTAYFAKESIPALGYVCVVRSRMPRPHSMHNLISKGSYFCFGSQHAATVQPQCLISNRY